MPRTDPLADAGQPAHGVEDAGRRHLYRKAPARRRAQPTGEGQGLVGDAHGVPRIAGLRVEEPGRRLAQVRRGEAQHPGRPARPGDHRRLQQPLHVDGDVPGPGREGAAQLRETPPDRQRPGTEHDAPVHDRRQVEHLLVPFVDDPADARGRKPVPERRRHRQRVHDVAQGAEADDEDGSHAATWPAGPEPPPLSRGRASR